MCMMDVSQEALPILVVGKNKRFVDKKCMIDKAERLNFNKN